jgi:hypothetical protein
LPGCKGDEEKLFFSLKEGRMRIFRLHGASFLFLCLFWASLVHGETQPSLVRVQAAGVPEALDPSFLKSMALEVVSKDLNFPGDGAGTFEGVLLARLMGEEESITLLSDDQYLVHLDADFVKKMGAMLVWSQNGLPIPRHRGGPQKLVFAAYEGLHPSLNAWYVTAFATGNSADGRALRLVQGEKVLLVAGKEALGPQGRIREMQPSVPKGYRQIAAFPGRQPVAGFVLEDLLKSRDLSWETLVLKSLAGRDLRLKRSEVEGRDLFLISYKNQSPLSLPCGGPWALWVPVLKYPDLGEKLPNPDGLFFVYEILVE